jgi:hypothetical protein
VFLFKVVQPSPQSTFSSPQKEIAYPLVVTSHFPPTTLALSNHFVFVILHVLNISYKVSYTIGGL